MLGNELETRRFPSELAQGSRKNNTDILRNNIILGHWIPSGRSHSRYQVKNRKETPRNVKRERERERVREMRETALI